MCHKTDEQKCGPGKTRKSVCEKKKKKKSEKGGEQKIRAVGGRRGYTTQQTWHVMRVEVYLIHTGHEGFIISLTFLSFSFAWGRILFCCTVQGVALILFFDSHVYQIMPVLLK